MDEQGYDRGFSKKKKKTLIKWKIINPNKEKRLQLNFIPKEEEKTIKKKGRFSEQDMALPHLK